MDYRRPDEKAAMADIQRSQEQDRSTKSALKTGIGLAATATGFGIGTQALGPIASRVMPFLNKYIPMEMAIKGISKVNPEIGRMLKKGVTQGLDLKDGLDFIKGQIQGKEKSTSSDKEKSATENRNIIEMESPELHRFITELIKKGRKPIEAGALAYSNKDFMKAINKIKNQHKANWGDIIESIYGTGEMAETNPQAAMAEEAMNPQGSSPANAPTAEAQAFSGQQAQQPPQQQQQQPGQGQAALMAILQKIQKSRGA